MNYVLLCYQITDEPLVFMSFSENHEDYQKVIDGNNLAINCNDSDYSDEVVDFFAELTPEYIEENKVALPMVFSDGEKLTISVVDFVM